MSASSAWVRVSSTTSDDRGTVRISGLASPGASVTVNGRRVALGDDGAWSVAVPSGAGPVVADVVAVSADGSSRARTSVTLGGR